MNVYETLFGGAGTANLESIIDEGAFLVDVRTTGEFACGNVKGSMNIPLDTLQASLSEFKDKKHIIVFCQSGGRSSMAKSILEQAGFTNVINGGTWNQVNQFVK
ncbi:MAG TPA: sulfurtransferase [Mucilaginibacter sp.]|jgi:rhodanese-related sulfurtransferase|nr:sulfurtransferase [Mucilaginibacter sp.]